MRASKPCGVTAPPAMTSAAKAARSWVLQSEGARIEAFIYRGREETPNIVNGTKFPGKDKLGTRASASQKDAARSVVSCSRADGCAAGTRRERNRSLSFAPRAPAGKGQSEFVFCRGDMRTGCSCLALRLGGRSLPPRRWVYTRFRFTAPSYFVGLTRRR